MTLMSNVEDSPVAIIVSLLARESPLSEQIGYGIEEEGVPFRVRASHDDDLTVAAYEAACDSGLRIGVAVAEHEIVLHHQRLPRNEPLFAVADPSVSVARAVGTNAARLAKRTPLKSTEES